MPSGRLMLKDRSHALRGKADGAVQGGRSAQAATLAAALFQRGFDK